jgi:hypothetical protein
MGLHGLVGIWFVIVGYQSQEVKLSLLIVVNSAFICDVGKEVMLI